MIEALKPHYKVIACLACNSILAIHTVQGFPLMTLHMRINIDKRCIHKYTEITEENELTLSARQTVAKMIDSQGSSYRSLAKRQSTARS